MKLKHLAIIAALTTPFTANADTLSISAGGGIWNASPTGNFQKTSDPVEVDVEDNLFWDEETQGYFFVTFEHFIPLIPNFRLIHTQLDQSGSGNTSFEFDGDVFTGDVSNDTSIQTTDLIAYYEVLDNVVSLDIGLNIRNLKVEYDISSADNNRKDSIDETIPMLYIAAGATPWPDLLISGELSYIALDGSSISDFTAKVSYTTEFFVGFEAGYRMQSFEFDDIADTDAKLDFDGVFAGAYIKF